MKFEKFKVIFVGVGIHVGAFLLWFFIFTERWVPAIQMACYMLMGFLYAKFEIMQVLEWKWRKVKEAERVKKGNQK